LVGNAAELKTLVLIATKDAVDESYRTKFDELGDAENVLVEVVAEELALPHEPEAG
jgi:hypothetical protein